MKKLYGILFSCTLIFVLLGCKKVINEPENDLTTYNISMDVDGVTWKGNGSALRTLSSGIVLVTAEKLQSIVGSDPQFSFVLLDSNFVSGKKTIFTTSHWPEHAYFTDDSGSTDIEYSTKDSLISNAYRGYMQINEVTTNAVSGTFEFTVTKLGLPNKSITNGQFTIPSKIF